MQRCSFDYGRSDSPKWIAYSRSTKIGAALNQRISATLWILIPLCQAAVIGGVSVQQNFFVAQALSALDLSTLIPKNHQKPSRTHGAWGIALWSGNWDPSLTPPLLVPGWCHQRSEHFTGLSAAQPRGKTVDFTVPPSVVYPPLSTHIHQIFLRFWGYPVTHGYPIDPLGVSGFSGYQGWSPSRSLGIIGSATALAMMRTGRGVSWWLWPIRCASFG